MIKFSINSKCDQTRARTGELVTAHGTIQTPIFMPVGTRGTVRTMTPEELRDAGTQIILGNTYHLYLKPGCEVIESFSGLHRFMNWDGPILTDSGGFQIFSLAKLAKITDQGVSFQSHIDGSRHMLTPEKVIEIQRCIGSDISMCLDYCLAYPANWEEAQKKLDLTMAWAKRCKDAWRTTGKTGLFGIAQGGFFKDLRKRSVDELVDLDFNGYAVGGLSVGEPKDLMHEMADFTLEQIPDIYPKYVMGVGKPEDLVEMVTFGADMFDCVLPTRNARNGNLITSFGAINICNSRFRHDTRPIDQECGCYTCLSYSRAYLRHLYMAKELLAYRLNTIHNIHYYLNLMEQIRTAICNNEFVRFKQRFYAKREQ